jgi:hypothetical protein
MTIAIVLTVVEFKIFTFLFFIVFGIFTLGIAAILAFARVNGRPIHFFMLNFVQTIKRPMLRVWNKASYVMGVSEVKSEIKKEVKKVTEQKEIISGSRLQDLSLLINTGGVYKSEEIEKE